MRNSEASVLFILGMLGAWGWSSKQCFFTFHWWSLHSDEVCRNIMEASVQPAAATSSQPAKACLGAETSLGQSLAWWW